MPTDDHTLDSQHWADTLRKLRLENDWSQRDLAERLDVHPQTVSDFERGRRQFTLERLNRILDTLGYKAIISLVPLEDHTRADWGPVKASEPPRRRQIKNCRQLAEDLSDFLYRAYDVDAVYAFGSLAENGGKEFTERSDIDLLVEGLVASEQFSAESDLEIDVVEESPFKGFTFDLVRLEDTDWDAKSLVNENRAVFIPELEQ